MGSVYRVKGSKNFWIKYYRNGRCFQESSKSDKKSEAMRLLKHREGQIVEGRFPGLQINKTTTDDLMGLLIKDYELNARKAIGKVKGYVANLRESFGGMRAANITSQHIQSYRERRRAEGVKDTTINRELSGLKRMYSLGLKQDPPLVTRIPNIELVRETNTRMGFLEIEEFQALRGVLPDHLKVMVIIAYNSGMRLGEILNLRWDHIDWDHGTMRLDPGTTKSGEGRLIPMMPEVREALEQWRLQTIEKWPQCPWVSHYEGKKITTIRRSWKTACKRVGLEGRLFHDLRRSAVRNLIRAGVPQAVAKKISGHKTDSVFNRYNIVSQGDLIEATEKLTQYIQEKKERVENGYSLGTVSTMSAHN